MGEGELMDAQEALKDLWKQAEKIRETDVSKD